jgi:hypothetical protein
MYKYCINMYMYIYIYILHTYSNYIYRNASHVLLVADFLDVFAWKLWKKPGVQHHGSRSCPGTWEVPKTLLFGLPKSRRVFHG